MRMNRVEMNALIMDQKQKREKLLKKKSHFWIHFLCGSGNIRALFDKRRTSESKKRKNKDSV